MFLIVFQRIIKLNSEAIEMDYVSMLGFAAAIVTTIAWIPQVWKVVRTQKTRDLSLGMLGIICLGAVLWLVYGGLVLSWPIIISNTLILLICLTLLGYKLKFG